MFVGVIAGPANVADATSSLLDSDCVRHPAQSHASLTGDSGATEPQPRGMPAGPPVRHEWAGKSFHVAPSVLVCLGLLALPKCGDPHLSFKRCPREDPQQLQGWRAGSRLRGSAGSCLLLRTCPAESEHCVWRLGRGGGKCPVA